MEQCFSGGMMDDILAAATQMGTSVCVMTAARFDEFSWGADTEGDYDEYVFHWTSAVFGRDPSGAPINADTNGDGTVTMREAHQYAQARDSASEHPQIGESMSGACDVTLIKTMPRLATLTVAIAGSGSGTVTSEPPGIDCPLDCEATYAHDTVVILTPTPASRAVFTGWSGAPDCSDGIVTMDANKTCIASFELDPSRGGAQSTDLLGENRATIR
jgi:Divergent InlB B-repeat domain